MTNVLIILLILAVVAFAAVAFLILKRSSNQDRTALNSLAASAQDLIDQKFLAQERALREILASQEKNTTTSLGHMNERLAIIRDAQKNMADLSEQLTNCLLYTSPSPRDGLLSRMPSSA